MASRANTGEHLSSNSLTDDQINDILREAEQRLAAKPAAAAVRDSTSSRPRDTTEREPGELKEKPLSIRSTYKPRPENKDTAGSDWFNLPKTDLTTQMKRDWQILRMRNVLDPKQQRKSLRAEPPKYSQVGQIVAGPTDFYSARLPRKEQKQNLLQEALSERNESKFRDRYAGIQKDKMSGKKAFYKKLVSQRRKNKR